MLYEVITRDMKLKVVPPDVNLSNYHFTEQSGNTVVYGLGAIKGVGQGAIEGMLAERAAGGPFADLVITSYSIHYTKLYDASLAGHVRIGDYAILGGFTLVHQFCT